MKGHRGAGDEEWKYFKHDCLAKAVAEVSAAVRTRVQRDVCGFRGRVSDAALIDRDGLTQLKEFPEVVLKLA